MTNFDAIFQWLKYSVKVQHIGSKRKDGRPSSKETRIKGFLTKLEIFVNEKIRLIQAPPSGQPIADQKLKEVDNQIKETLASLQAENFLKYDQRLVLKQLVQDTSPEALKDVLISQSDGSRSGYLGYITGPHGLASKSGHSFSAYSSAKKNIQPLTLGDPKETLIENQRLPIPPAIKEAAERIGMKVENNFGCNSDLALCILINELAQKGYETTNQVNVENIVKELGLYDDSITILNHYRSLFIPASGMQHLPYFLIDRHTWYPAMAEQEGYVVSKARYGCSDSKNDDRIKMTELKETLVDFAFLVAALDLKKPVYGSCQGAHVGWLLAGGEIVKWNKYKFNTGRDTIESVQDLGEKHALDVNVEKAALDENSYASDEYILLPIHHHDRIRVLTDFHHATVMYHNNLSYLKKGVEKITRHPLHDTMQHVEINIVKKDVIDSHSVRREITEQIILDIAKKAVEYFTYKTLIATQSHVFKHLDNPNSCAFVLDALGFSKMGPQYANGQQPIKRSKLRFFSRDESVRRSIDDSSPEYPRV